jgi:hypothetical protein
MRWAPETGLPYLQPSRLCWLRPRRRRRDDDAEEESTAA